MSRQNQQREDFAAIMHDLAIELYKEDTGIDMSVRQKKLIKEGINWAVCEFKDDPCLNDVFKRAAIIGYQWTKGASDSESLGASALSLMLAYFLKREGADFPSLSNEEVFRKEIADVFQDYRWDAGEEGLPQIFLDIHQVCAKCWICAQGNCLFGFKHKLCHKVGRFDLMSA